MAKSTKIKVFRLGQAYAVYIPQKLRTDSLYPFSEEEESELVMEIKGNSLIIRLPKEDDTTE